MAGTSLLDPNILRNDPALGDVDTGFWDQFGKGLKSSVTGTYAGLRGMSGTVGEMVGADEFAQAEFQRARELQAEAQAQGPRIGSYKDAGGSLRDATSYVGGILGGSAPSMALGMGAGMVARTALGGLAAGTLAQTPLEAADVAMKQLNDPGAMAQPAGERFARQIGGGAASAGLQTIIPNMVGGKLVGRGAEQAAKQSIKQIAGRNAMSIPAEGFFEGSSEGLKQMAANNENGLNWDQIGENVVGGMVGGAPMAGAGFVGDTAGRVAPQAREAFGSARESINERLSRAKGAAGEQIDAAAATAPGKKIRSAYDDIADMVERGKGKFDDTVDKILKGEELGDPGDWLRATTDEAKKRMADFSDNERVKAATQWGKDLLNKLRPDDPRRGPVEAADPNTVDGQMLLASEKKKFDASEDADAKIDALSEAMGGDEVTDVVDKNEAVQPSAAPQAKPTINQRKKFIEDAMASGMTQEQARTAFVESMNGPRLDDPTPPEVPKLSADYSGVQKVIADAIKDNGIVSRRPELFDTDRKIEAISRNMRLLMERLPKGPLDETVVKSVTRVFGDDTDSVINSLKRTLAVDMTPQESENFFGNLRLMKDINEGEKGLVDVMRSSLTDEARTRQQMPEKDAEALIKHARGQVGAERSAQKEYFDRLVDEYYKNNFGDKADTVRAAVEKAAGLDKGRIDGDVANIDESGALVGASEGGFDEGGNRLNEQPLDTLKFGLTEPDAKGNSNSKLGGTPMAEDNRYVKQHISDLEKKYPGHEFKWVKDENSAEGFGHIVGEKAADPEALTANDVQGMRLSDKFPNSPDKIKVGGMALDTKRIAKVMDRRLEYSVADEQSRAHRMARMFNEGIARLTEQYGKIDVADTSVIGKVGGKNFTFGEARKLKSDTATPENPRIAELRKEYRGASPQDKSDILREIDDLKNAELSREPYSIQDKLIEADEATKPMKASKDGQIHQAAADLKPSELEQRSNEDGSKHSHNASDRTTGNDALDGLANEMLAARSKAAQAIGGRIKTLLATKLTAKDEAKLNSILAGPVEGTRKPAAEIAAIVNPMAAKYAARAEGATEPEEATEPAGRTSKPSLMELLSRLNEINYRLENPESVDTRKYLKGLDSQRMAMEAMIAELEGSPDPKPQAPAKGAARSGDTVQLPKEVASAISTILNGGTLPEGFRFAYKGSEIRIRSEAEIAAMSPKERTRARYANQATVNLLKHLTSPNPLGVATWAKKMGLDPNAPGMTTRYLSEGRQDMQPPEIDLKNGTMRVDSAPETKKQAFLKRAAEGDKALLEELGASNDAKGLQRALDALNEHVFDGSARDDNIQAAFDVLTDRLSELVQDLDVAYGLQTTKYSLEAVAIHTDLGRDGFAATHDSPIRHEGKFDWRAHQGKGEGNASFGAGTYLSTAEGVHQSYKNQFTASVVGLSAKTRMMQLNGHLKRAQQELGMVRAEGKAGVQARIDSLTKELNALPKSPTYEVSVNIKPEQLLDWGAPISQQSDDMLEAISMNSRDNQTMRKAAGNPEYWSGGEFYTALARELGSQYKASDYLQSLGILGHKYAAEGGENDTHPNYVIYDDSKITTNYVRFDKSAADPNAINPKTERDAVKAHILKVLGPTVKVAWKNLTTMKHAGDYTHSLKLIRLSVHAINPMSTAYHESLHAFFGQLRDAGATDITKVLEKAASSQLVIDQLKQRYAGQPEVLNQLKDPEERAAYMYQMWASDPTFKIAINAKSVFGRIKAFIQRLAGAWTNDERALHIMEYFHSGEYAKNMGSPSAVRHAMMDTHRSQILETAQSFAEPLGRLADAVVGTGGARLRDTGVPALVQLADIFKREHTSEGGDQGFIAASRIEGAKMRTQLGELLSPYSPEHLHDAMEALQSNTPAVSTEAQQAVKDIKKFLRAAHNYMTKAGVNIGDLGPDYFPRVWDTHYISKNQQAFRDMLEPYIRSGQMKGSADDLIRSLLAREGAEFGIESREPGMQHKKERLLDFITPQDSAQFVEKNLLATMSSYINQASRKAEWTRRLGGGKLEQLLDDARSQGATTEQLDVAEDYMKGIDGTLGATGGPFEMTPTARRLMGNMIVYQNIRLLPMAAFSMLIDPMGIMVRGGSVGQAYTTFKRGIAGIKDTFAKDGGQSRADQATKWAELIGVVDSAMMTHAMSDIYSQGMVGGTAKKINNAFFRFNLVEGLNRNFRIGASEAAMKFMAHHADGLSGKGPSTHSVRWMKELGLQKGDIIVTPAGHLALTEQDGLSAAQVQRVHAAINQWVDGAVLRPDAADKPIWMNDPHYALISHLKQFVFSFQKTILARVAHEFRNGNYTPSMALASYVPIMIAADTAKGLLGNAGDTPEWKKGWTVADHVGYGVERAGLFGVGQFGLDIAQDLKRGGTGVGSLTGPTIDQLGDMVSTLGGRRQFGTTVLDALPANTLLKGWSGKGEAKADPVAES